MVNVNGITLLRVCVECRSLVRDSTFVGLEWLCGYAWPCDESVMHPSRPVQRINIWGDFLTIDYKDMNFL